MVLAGGLGGFASYLSTEIEQSETHPCLKRIALGAIAALVVPAFLNMISSSILADVMNPKDYFVFAGFCLVAGFSSKAFLSSMSKSILDRMDNVEGRQAALEEEIDPILDKETEPELEASDSKIIESLGLDQEDLQVLRALNNPEYTRRYVPGLVSETKLGDTNVAYSLHKMKDMGLVGQRKGMKKELFWLTHEGRNVAKAADV